MRISYGLAEREMAVILFSTIGGACNHAGGLIEKYPPPFFIFYYYCYYRSCTDKRCVFIKSYTQQLKDCGGLFWVFFFVNRGTTHQV